jgi:hypothetical protein
MTSPIAEIVDAIRSYQPGADWLELDNLLEELFVSCERHEVPTEALFGVFERFPEHDGFGVFWRILHGIEEVPGYEAELVGSLRRVRSRFGLVMARRVLGSNEPAAREWHETLSAIVGAAETP